MQALGTSPCSRHNQCLEQLTTTLLNRIRVRAAGFRGCVVFVPASEPYNVNLPQLTDLLQQHLRH